MSGHPTPTAERAEPVRHIAVRRLTASDGPQIERLFARLDQEDRYRRWFTAIPDVHRLVDAAMDEALPGDVGLVATVDGAVVGHALLARIDDERAEVAFEVDPDWRRHGIAGRLLDEAEAVAAGLGYRRLVADVLWENRDMLAVFHEHGPCTESRRAGVVHLELPVATGD
jgi:GNAT superfamily N-acetyltransferase